MKKEDKWPCNYCKEFGHWIKDCPKGKKKQQANSAHDGENDYLVNGTQGQSMNDAWYVDTGATLHMTHKKELLENYQEIEPKEIYLGEDHSIQAVGIGEVKLKMEVEGKINNWRVQNVHYVPRIHEKNSHVSVKEKVRIVIDGPHLEMLDKTSGKTMGKAIMKKGKI